MRIPILAVSLVALAAPVLAQEEVAPAGLAMTAIAGSGPIVDPTVFAAAAPTAVALFPQVITTPRNPTPATAALEVRAVRNADHAAFLLEWADASADWRGDLDAFGDMAAIQLPVAPDSGATPFMGNPGGRVQILQWRANWQRDLEQGAPTLRDIYPNAYTADFHPEERLPEPAATAFRGAEGAGNPMAARVRESAVQDLMAEGFGSLTPRASQAAAGAGRHDGARWQVVITRPLEPRGESAASLAPGTRTQIAFAVWNGSAGEVGARKAWAAWVPLEVPR
jgi:hypothetical protein